MVDGSQDSSVSGLFQVAIPTGFAARRQADAYLLDWAVHNLRAGAERGSRVRLTSAA